MRILRSNCESFLRVCYINLLEQGGYKLPASLEHVKSADKVEDIQTDIIDDTMIVLGQVSGLRWDVAY